MDTRSTTKTQMHLTPPEAVQEQTKIRPETLARLKKLHDRDALGDYKVSKDAVLHCHIPVCIGYGSGSMGSEELAALVNGIREKGYDFTIYPAPRKQFDKEKEDPYSVWLRDNEALLSEVEGKVILENQWRETEQWKVANVQYEQFKSKNEGLIKNLLTRDVAQYLKRKKTSSVESSSSIGEAEITQHMLSCVVDCVSWMVPRPTDQDTKVTRTNVLIYTHNLPQLMQNVFQNAEKIGCLHNSLVHVEPKFEQLIVQADTVSASTVSPQQYAQSLSSNEPGLTPFQKEALVTISNLCFINKTVDPLYAGKVLAAMVSAFERGSSNQDEVPAVLASPILTVVPSAGRASELGMFGGSPEQRDRRSSVSATSSPPSSQSSPLSSSPPSSSSLFTQRI